MKFKAWKHIKYNTKNGTISFDAPKDLAKCQTMLASAVFTLHEVEGLYNKMLQKTCELRTMLESAKADELAYQQTIDELDSLINNLRH